MEKKTHTVLFVISGSVLVLLAFGVGVAVGYRRGVFSSHFGEEYYQNFYGAVPQGGPAGTFSVMGNMPGVGPHGAAGIVLEVQSSSIAAQDIEGDEESIAVGTDTVIRRMNQTISVQSVDPGEGIIVIGEPNGEGQIRARFIRIFPATTSQPAQ